MFITATIATTVSVAPTANGSSWAPMNGNVKLCIQTPAPTGIAAAKTWPASFSHQRRPRKSSIAPTVVATAAPSRIPRISPPSGRNASAGTKTPMNSASPPSRGTPRGFARRPPSGRSTTPSRRAMPADRRRQRYDDHERDEGSPDDLQIVRQLIPDHGLRLQTVRVLVAPRTSSRAYFVP